MLTNLELAGSLRALADMYERNAEAELIKPMLYVFAHSKGEAIAIIKAVGGKFKKHMGLDNDPYSQITFKSERIPGLTVQIARDKVCRKTVKWECEPLLSPEDEAELETVSA
jgi:hypothetical protein